MDHGDPAVLEIFDQVDALWGDGLWSCEDHAVAGFADQTFHRIFKESKIISYTALEYGVTSLTSVAGETFRQLGEKWIVDLRDDQPQGLYFLKSLENPIVFLLIF